MRYSVYFLCLLALALTILSPWGIDVEMVRSLEREPTALERSAYRTGISVGILFSIGAAVIFDLFSWLIRRSR